MLWALELLPPSSLLWKNTNVSILSLGWCWDCGTSNSGISTLYNYCDEGSNHLCQGSKCCFHFLDCCVHTDSPHFSTDLSGYSLSRRTRFLLSAVQDPLNQSYTLLQSSFSPRPGLAIPLLSTWYTSVYRLEILLSLFMCLDHNNLEKASLIQTVVSK